jgi:hypothetical protein
MPAWLQGSVLVLYTTIAKLLPSLTALQQCITVKLLLLTLQLDMPGVLDTLSFGAHHVIAFKQPYKSCVCYCRRCYYAEQQ